MRGSHIPSSPSLDSEKPAHCHRARKYSIAVSVIAFLALAGLLIHPHYRSPPSPIHAHSRLSLGLGELIQAVCRHTPFPDACARELSGFRIPITASPSAIVSLAVRAAVSRVDEGLQLASRCAQEQGLRRLESQCASDCAELMADTKDKLGLAMGKLSQLRASDLGSLKTYLRDVKVWLSTSMSYQAACSDSFEDAPGSVQAQIDGSQTYIGEVIGNALSLVDILSEVGDDVGSWARIAALPPPHLRRRRLLSSSVGSDEAAPDGIPPWVSAAQRKLLQAPAPTISVGGNVVVAQDGSGQFLNVTAALDSIPAGYQGRYVIYIKAGVYDEVFNITKDLENLTFLGDGAGDTIITGDRNVASGQYNTYRTSTVGISGSGFFARDITFRNTAGPGGHQAVAVRAGADFVVFYKCSFEGYQDTLYALSSRQFYRDCRISGTVDFIFGNAIAVFQNCEIAARLPLPNQQNTYTAQGRKLAADISGYSFQNCTLTGEPDLLNASSVPTFLGRPWKAYSRVVFIQSQFQALVDPAGWLPWNSTNPFTDTLYYGEYQNHGPGSSTSARVTWAGVHPNMTLDEAAQFTVGNLVGTGQTWLAPLQVEYQDNLS